MLNLCSIESYDSTSPIEQLWDEKGYTNDTMNELHY